MSIIRRQFATKLFSPQLASNKMAVLPLRHCVSVATPTQNAVPYNPPPTTAQTLDTFGIGTAVQPPEPKWQKAGLRIELNCADEQIFQSIVQEIVDRFGWDNSAYDYAMWRKAFGPNNFGMFFALDENRVPMASTSMAVYPRIAHWSMYYVKERFRGHKLGRALTQRAMEMAGDRHIFGYGVAEMWAKYAEEYGMCHFLDWQLWSLLAKSADVRPERLDNDSSVVLKDWQEVPFQKLLNFDVQQTAGIDRSMYLREALRLPESVAKLAISKETGEVVGMCQARHLMSRRIGISLFYAEKASVASSLLRAVLLQFAGPDPSAKFDSLLYKTPSTNAESMRILRKLIQNGPVQRHILTPQFTRHSLPFPGQRIFSISDEHVSLI
ncbi:hypothetical protein niasHT_035702 [Heterodera trifolii]|uniref:N-acetyltransferase domain-containing protein n=1 Tax=Heterodera trifolii TaxID=157864 RepID=A0ABD2I2I1_9BILA